MDASRLGHAGPLPAALLRDAAVGYLADPDRIVGHAGEWDTALAWATDSGWALQPVPPTAAGDGTPGYRVAGYLDQYGRRTRADQPGPASLCLFAKGGNCRSGCDYRRPQRELSRRTT
jgi:hypothetical protein